MENKGKTWSRGTISRLPFGVNMNLNFSNMMKTACSTKLQQPVIAEGGSLIILTVDVYRGFTDFRFFVSRLLDGKKLIYTWKETACVHRAIKLVIFLEAVLKICFKISFSTEI